jgi:hypothetical protein
LEFVKTERSCVIPKAFLNMVARLFIAISALLEWHRVLFNFQNIAGHTLPAIPLGVNT